MRLMLLFCLLGGSLPLWAQLYSYRSPAGKLIITDRIINKKGYKLLDMQKPREQEEKEEESYGAQGRPPVSGKLDPRFQLTPRQLINLVHPIAKAMDVDPELARAVVLVESSGNYRAKSSKGAMGLMQLMPATADRFGVKNPWDPRQNIKGGIKYLRWLLAYFEGNVDLALAGYNAGENAVDRHGGIPPYKETRNYVKKIRLLYDKQSISFDASIPHRSKLLRNGDDADKVKAKLASNRANSAPD